MLGTIVGGNDEYTCAFSCGQHNNVIPSVEVLALAVQRLGWQRRIVDLQVHIDLNHQRLQFITEQSITPNRTSITDAVDQILKYGKGS